jgi:hypothetical protein
MRHFSLLLAAVLLFPLTGHSAPDDEDEADEPPPGGQPAHFSGAIGTFRVTARAEPVALQAEDPLTYRLCITATGPSRRGPNRPHLQDFPAFQEGFYIEEVGPPEGDRPDRQTWEYTYRLRPRSTAVQAVPGFPLVSYRPGVIPPRRGYQTIYAPEIPLTVSPRAEVGPPPGVETALTAPESAFEIEPSEVVLLQEETELQAGPITLALAVLLPPSVCTCWYLVWRRLYPDAARLAWKRRSRAAREALKALRRRPPAALDEQARGTAAVVARYLRHRYGWTVEEPTPAEACRFLAAQGVAAALADQVAVFFRDCDAQRFGPVPLTRPDLTAAATCIIVALEMEPCSS